MRSLLVLPQETDHRSLDEALGSGAEAVILDLRAAARAKTGAPATLRAVLDEHAGRQAGPRLFVRIDRLASGMADADLAAVIPARPTGVVLSDAAGGADVQHLASLLSVHEAEAGLADGATGILAVAGATAASVLRMSSFEDAGTRLRGLAWTGGVATARPVPLGHLAEPSRLARSLLVLTAAAAGVPAIDRVFANIQDTAGLLRECEAAQRDGFAGKLAIHPAQVRIINEVFGEA